MMLGKPLHVCSGLSGDTASPREDRAFPVDTDGFQKVVNQQQWRRLCSAYSLKGLLGDKTSLRTQSSSR